MRSVQVFFVMSQAQYFQNTEVGFIIQARELLMHVTGSLVSDMLDLVAF